MKSWQEIVTSSMILGCVLIAGGASHVPTAAADTPQVINCENRDTSGERFSCGVFARHSSPSG